MIYECGYCISMNQDNSLEPSLVLLSKRCTRSITNAHFSTDHQIIWMFTEIPSSLAEGGWDEDI